ncbi:MAG: carboxylating nicotinate-nucleotide diphosphorylase [Nodosilinea sp.]
MSTPLPLTLPAIALDPLLRTWLQEDIGRGDWSSAGLGPLGQRLFQAQWVAKAPGIVAGLPVAARVFTLLEGGVKFEALVTEGETCEVNTPIAHLSGPLACLLMGERVALNLAMRLSGIATATRQYVEALAHCPSQFVDTRKTTPGLRILEKYASRVGGATNHRLGLDDAVMLKDNHIAAAGGVRAAVEQVRQAMPYPLSLEVEVSNLTEVEEALTCPIDIIMLDNMSVETMTTAVQRLRQAQPNLKIEASGNVSLATLGPISATGVDFISSSGPITRSTWLDLSMRLVM